MNVTLLDLSNNNPDPINWEAVRRGGCFGVWHKVSEAETYTDPFWQERAAKARAAGLHVGGYHFARPVKGHGTSEGDYFAGRLGKITRRDLRPVLDLEKNDSHLSPAELEVWARQFQVAVHNRTGVRCLLYSGPYFISSLKWERPLGTGAGLWLADYGTNDGTDHGPHVPAPWRRCIAHQFTSVGTWPGVNGHVDVSHAPRRRHLLAHGLRGIL